MKKRTKKKMKKTKASKQKIDVILASLLNLETQMRNLISRIDQLENQRNYYFQPPYKYPEQPIVWW